MFLFKKKNKSGTAPAKSASKSSTPAPLSPVISGAMNGTFVLTPNGSQKYSFPRPPRLSPSSNLLASSPTSKVLNFDSPKQAPASYVRHVRAASGASNTVNGEKVRSPSLPQLTLQDRQRMVNSDLPPELLPVVNLMNTQKLRQYNTGVVSVLSSDQKTWLPADATLTGTELAIQMLGSGSTRYINIQDSSIFPNPARESPAAGHDLVILQDFDSRLLTLRFSDVEQMYTWLAAIHLAKFESTSLQEAFTAVILSLKGPELSDIFTLLSHKQRFARYEWSNLRLPQISNKWIKVYVCITPGDNKKKGRIEIYASEKITKKNLVLYVDALDSVYNVYPEDYRMIDFNLIMKLEGDVHVNKNYQHLFVHGNDGEVKSPKINSSPVKKSDSAMSLSSFGPPNAVLASPVRSRSNSISSSSSFFFNNLTTGTENDSQGGAMPSFFKKNVNSNFVKTDYLYLMPESHPGVSIIEIMLRNFIHIIDAFKLYGRPEHLISSKRDPLSMLFGLPALPHHCYMDLSDAIEVVAVNFELSCLKNWSLSDWRVTLKEYLSCKQRDSDFRGSGNIYELFNSLELPANSPNVAQFPTMQTSDQLQQSLTSKLRSPFLDSALKSLESMPSTNASNSGALPSLGNGFDFKRSEQETYNSFSFAQRSLHPIIDMPTPHDEKAQPNLIPKEGIAVQL